MTYLLVIVFMLNGQPQGALMQMPSMQACQEALPHARLKAPENAQLACVALHPEKKASTL